jgi:hypothetical protein
VGDRTQMKRKRYVQRDNPLRNTAPDRKAPDVTAMSENCRCWSLSPGTNWHLYALPLPVESLSSCEFVNTLGFGTGATGNGP